MTVNDFKMSPNEYLKEKDTDTNMDAIYVNVLYSIMHPIGRCVCGFTTDQQKMFDSVQLAFGMTKKTHSKLMSVATKRAAPRIVLRVRVFEAKSLKAKDMIGTSDPYCVLGIQSEKYLNSTKRTAMEMLPKDEQSKTRILMKELNPVWNEFFQFVIQNPEKDCFLLDIWDNDPKQSFSETVLNLGHTECHKLRRGMQDMRKVIVGEDTDDFLGRMSYPVKSIASTGDSEWYTMEGRSDRSDIEGMVLIGFRLTVIEPKIPIETGSIKEFPVDDNCNEQISQNIEVITVFINYTLSNVYLSEFENWLGSMDIALLTVIHLHALHNNLSEFQEDLSLWKAYVEQHHKQSMCYSAMLYHLNRLQMSWDRTDRKSLHLDETLILKKAFFTFVGDSLRKFHCFRDTSRDGPDFNNLLKCLEILNKLELVSMLYPEYKLNDQIEMTLREGTREWYKNISTIVEPLTKQPKYVIQSLLYLTCNIIDDFEKAHCYYKSKFNMIDIEYETLIYPLVEEHLVTTITNVFNTIGSAKRIVISEIIKFRKNWENEEELCNIYFQLYIVLKKVSRYLERITLDRRHSPNLTELHEWFRYHLELWMVMNREKSLAFIRKAVTFDEATQVSDLISFSSSAVDVGVCFNELTEMVDQIDWPNECESYAIGNHFLQMISDGAQLYAELIYEKLKAVNFFDDIGQFDVSDQLYRIINSIEKVRLSIAPQFNKLDILQPVCATLSVNDAERTTFLSETRDIMLRDANSTIVEVIQSALMAVAVEMQNDLTEKMMAISSAYCLGNKEDAFGRLEDYLEENLFALHANLMVANFDRFLLTLWNILLKIIGEITLNNAGKEAAYFDWMCLVLDRIEKIFYANGNGLACGVMETDEFIEIKKEILLRGEMNTSKENIGRFFSCCP